MARILVLDDETRLLKTVRRFLEREGHDVVTGERFSEIDSLVIPGAFDVLLSDIVMPEHTGIDVLRTVVSRGCSEPVILMTGEPSVETAAEAVRLGAYDYLAKPVTKSDLTAVVTRAVRHVELVRERDQARNAEESILAHLAEVARSSTSIAAELREGTSRVRAVLDGGAGGEGREVLEDLVERMDRVEHLVERTLAFARPLSLARQDVDLGALVAAAVERYPGEAGADVVWSEPTEEIHTHGDPRLLEAVVWNLLENADEAAGPVGKVEVTVARWKDGGAAVIVEDDGPGIADSDRHRLFVPFETTKSRAVGLGLAECRKIVEAHGGSIEVGTGTRGGARFRVLLPADHG